MKLDGAPEPHGAPHIGCSTGAEKYRAKQRLHCYKSNAAAAATIPSTTTTATATQSNNYNACLNRRNRSNRRRNSQHKDIANNIHHRTNSNYTKNYNQNGKYHYPLSLALQATYKYIICTKTNIDIPLHSSDNSTKTTTPIKCNGRGLGTKLSTNTMATLMGDGVVGIARNMKRAQQSFRAAAAGRSCAAGTVVALTLLYVFVFLPNAVICDDNDNTFFNVNSFSMGPETTTPEFDYASRGKKKYGDKCENTLECGFPGSICDHKQKACQCTDDLPITNHFDKCGKEAAVNETCFFNEQCEAFYFQTECRDGRCICRFEMSPNRNEDGTFECKGRQEQGGPERYVDPAMIGVLVGMALMFIIICVVLRLFSQARWRENRTIFNTPNPRLMNVSLLRESKLLHGQERRGSRMSVRAPSRQPSMASLRPHSPNPSLGSRRGSRGSSNASATSIRSNRSNSVVPGTVVNANYERKGSGQHQHHSHQHHQQQQQQQPLITNITPNPAAENVTIEIIEP